jgi:diaminopimelate epimerase
MLKVPFTKASACGNDFLIIDSRHAPADLHEFSKLICNRHNGVGADGVEWLRLSPAQDADAAIRLINADGSEAEISGNGTRCVAAYLADIRGASRFAIHTGAGIKNCELISRHENSFEFEMDMGSPDIGKPLPLKIGAAEVRGTPVSMGNPHFVVFVSEFSPRWQDEAAHIQQQSEFKRDGVNVEFVRVTSQSGIEVRFFERGVGETQSSGTGSCASAVASIGAGKVKSPVSVQATGGIQVVRWAGDTVFLRGSAQLICKGEFFA